MKGVGALLTSGVKGFGEAFKEDIGDSLGEAAANVVSNITDALSGAIDEYLDVYTEYMSTINARIQGAYAGVDYTDLEKIILAPELVENATAEQINMFLLGLREEAKINHWQHVHLVTHLPILGLICQQRLSLPMGDVLVFECDDSSKIKSINQLHIEAMIEVPKYQQLANKLNKVKLKSSEDVLGVLLSCDEL